jgi:signal transduction histidine kinase/CheY-like chemotaxis protein
MSIRRKLLSVVLLTTFVALLCSLAVDIVRASVEFRENTVADVTTQSELLGRMTAPALVFNDPKLAAENLKLLQVQRKILAAAIYNEHGALFASYVAPGDSGRFPPLPEAEGARVEGKNLTLFKRIVENGTILGTVYLRMEYDLVGAVIVDIETAMIVMFFSMLIALFITTWLGRKVTRPIGAIAEIARDVVKQRDYSRRAEKMSDDEVGVLVESFNDMLAEIERRTEELEVSNRKIARVAEEREHAQQEVMRLNAGLELRVGERTAELEESNKALASAKAMADAANEAKTSFLSSMSHELRTPLNAILGFGQLLASDSPTPTAEQRKEFAGYILKSGRHLLSLINEILDLAKVESGAITLSIESVALAEVVQECQAMTEPLGQQRDLRMTFPNGSDLAVLADRTRLKQILLNLLSNAVKYNRVSGSLAVACAANGEGNVRISVHDTGGGLTAEQMDRLFQPFNRLGQETGAEEGTGIGLVLTKRLAELMGGSIGVSSTVGIGSVFWIELKAAQPVAILQEIAPDNSASQTGVIRNESSLPTMLYVEDNPTNLKLVEQIVRSRSDLRLMSAPDAHLGIQLAHAHLPAVILMDIHLPGMNGIEAMKMLRSDPRTTDIPIIAVTASAMPKDVEIGMRSGFFRYITKPIDIAEFMKAIDSALVVAANRPVRNPSEESEP